MSAQHDRVPLEFLTPCCWRSVSVFMHGGSNGGWNLAEIRPCQCSTTGNLSAAELCLAERTDQDHSVECLTEISVAHRALLTIHNEFLSINKQLGDAVKQADADFLHFSSLQTFSSRHPLSLVCQCGIVLQNKETSEQAIITAGTQNTHSPQDAGKHRPKNKNTIR